MFVVRSARKYIFSDTYMYPNSPSAPSCVLLPIGHVLTVGGSIWAQYQTMFSYVSKRWRWCARCPFLFYFCTTPAQRLSARRWVSLDKEGDSAQSGASMACTRFLFDLTPLAPCRLWRGSGGPFICTHSPLCCVCLRGSLSFVFDYFATFY